MDELEEMISEDITLDSRVHARIIGARGKGIRKIMDEFKVRLLTGQETIPSNDTQFKGQTLYYHSTQLASKYTVIWDVTSVLGNVKASL